MTVRQSFADALANERDVELWQVSLILDDLEGCTDAPSTDRAVIAHVLWAHGVTPDHLGECRADEEHSIYANECEPCKELLLATADRLLSRIVLTT